jgi:hypothetical protein
VASKRFKDKLCVYCSRRAATTGDHVFPREFFSHGEDRANLPQVPTCDACNNAKSKLEHYLTAVLPFGARHAGARDNLAQLVPGRLSKNLRLARDLNAGRGTTWHLEEGIYQPTMTMPLDGEQLTGFFAYVGRGLAWHHWQVRLDQAHTSSALCLSRLGDALFTRVFTMRAANRVHRDFGKGTIRYSGVQATDPPQLTLWRLRVFGGIAVSGDPSVPGQVATDIGIVTGPSRFVAHFGRRAHEA